MYTPAFLTILLSATAVLGLAVPGPDAALFERGARIVNPNAITNTTCLDKATTINDHEINVSSFSVLNPLPSPFPTSQSAQTLPKSSNLLITYTGRTPLNLWRYSRQNRTMRGQSH
jgi:hypothetical protein